MTLLGFPSRPVNIIVIFGLSINMIVLEYGTDQLALTN